MPSESGITISVQGQDRVVPVEILDQTYRRNGRGYGRLNMNLPPGLYIARCNMAGSLAERIVKVQEGRITDVIFNENEIPSLLSAAPVRGSISLHEYYASAATEASRTPKEKIGAGANLMFFASVYRGTTTGQTTLKTPVHLRGLKVLSENRKKEIVVLPGRDVLQEDDIRYGRAAWSVELNPGGYILEWPAEDLGLGYRSYLPLWLSQGWTTAIFANSPPAGGVPDRRTLSIQMCRKEFQPYDDPTMTAAELALASLRSGRRQLADDDLRRLLHEKFKNPMLGILGAHMLLQQQQPQVALLAEVILNLEHLLGDHPDVSALRLMARHRFRTESQFQAASNSPPEFPPILRAGIDAMLDAEWDSGESAKFGDLDSAARYQLLPEEPWTFFWKKIIPLRHSDMADNELISMTESKLRRASRYIAKPSASIESTFRLKMSEKTLRPRLKAFIGQIQEKEGPAGVQKLKPEHLRWTGLKPDRVAQILEELARAAT